MQTTADIKDQVLVELGASTTLAYYTDDILNDWIDKAHKWAAGFKKWPFTEGRVSTTYASLVTDEDGNLRGESPEGWKSDSIRLLSIGGKRLTKTNHRAFQAFREDHPTASDRIFTDFGRLYLINPYADVSGTIAVWGQFTPLTLDATDPTAQTVFSLTEEDGNDTLVQEVLSYAMLREKKQGEAQAYHQKTIEMLLGIWERYKDEQFVYQGKELGMFERIDVVRGRGRSELNSENQF